MGFKDFAQLVNNSKEVLFKTILNSSMKNNSLNKTFHISGTQKYKNAAILPLPVNIDPSETTRFSPQRSRDISATAILSHQSKIDITLDNSSSTGGLSFEKTNDPHVDSYDCFGAVSLNSSMQSNVPSPFGGLHKFTHLNMPGGQWSQDSKFMSHNLHSSHYTNLRREARASWSDYDQDATIEKQKGIINNFCLLGNYNYNINNKFYKHHQTLINNIHSLFDLHDFNKNNSSIRNFSTNFIQRQSDKQNNLKEKNSSSSSNDYTINKNNLTKKEKLKIAFKEYGSTVIIFHVGISLVSLGMFYLLVSSGVDVLLIVEKIGLGSESLTSKRATEAGTFVLAYAVHKIFAPVRISITLGATPFIVKYLRRIGFLKIKPKT